MRKLPVVLYVVSALGLAACSESPAIDDDLLAGVSTSTIDELCVEMVHIPDATAIRQAGSVTPDFWEFQPPDVALASLGETASKLGAKDFSDVAADASKKANVVLLAAPNSDDSTVDQLLEDIFRFELADTRLRLSCAIHGYNIFRVDSPASPGVEPASPTTTAP